MSFLNEVINKKKQLKTVKTVVTLSSGMKFIEERSNEGKLEIKKLQERSLGMVIDEKLDLEIVEILDYLFLGSQDPAQCFDLLNKYSITHILSIGIDLPTSIISSSFVYKKVNLLDEPGASITDALFSSFQFISEVRKKDSKNKIFVHCNAGYSRGPTIVIGYLMKEFGYTLTEALNKVKCKRNVRPNEGFIKQLKQLELNLLFT